MSKIHVHEYDCLMKLGDKYTQVHEWLDEYTKEYPIYEFGQYHRKFRHHRKGIEEVRSIWGDGAARAAEIHILDDFGFIIGDEDKKENK